MKVSSVLSLGPCAVLALALSGSLVAQDKIYWIDGSVQEKVKVTSFSLPQIEFRNSRGTTSKPGHLVRDIERVEVKDEYARAFGAPLNERVDTFLGIAEGLVGNDDDLAQYGYWEAAKLARDTGNAEKAVLILDELQKKLPNSGFRREFYRFKIDYYLTRGRLNDASSVADQYLLDAQTKGFPTGYVVEGKYLTAMLNARKNNSSPADLRRAMQPILSDAAELPDVRSRILMEIANTYRFEKAFDKAEAEYNRILELDGAPDDALGGAYLGLGHCDLQRDEHRSAMLLFLRAYLEVDAPAVAPEALHFAADAAKSWGGPDARLIQKRLLYRLTRDYPESEFAKLH